MAMRERNEGQGNSHPTLQQIIERLGRRFECDTLVGEVLPDRNFDDHILIVSDRDTYYSVPRDIILETEPVGPTTFRLFVRRGGSIWRATRTSLSSQNSASMFAVEMFEPPPKVRVIPSDPHEGTSQDQQKLTDGRTIEGAAKLYSSECAGGDEYANNCAHFLSDAFIRAGFTDLGNSHTCISARCGTLAKRPIRARDMRCWFEAMSTSTGGAVKRNTGIWAVFQLKESDYWGGHVAIVDSDSWKFYGTGWYNDWDQHSFKW
jgi:hypothetical protein